MPLLPIVDRDRAATHIGRLEHEHAADAADLGVAMLARAHLLDRRVPNGSIIRAIEARQTLAHVWERRIASPRFAGFGLWRHGQLIGTLGAAYRQYPPGSEDLLWSPQSGAWMPQVLCAIAQKQHPGVVLPPLYEAVVSWLSEQGLSIPLQFASVPAADQEGLDVWQELGFRPQGIFALLDESARDALKARRALDSVRIRRAKRDDADAVAMLLAESHRYHALLPGSFYAPDDGDRHYLAVVRRELASPDGPRYVLAEQHGQIIGCASSVLRDVSRDDPVRYMHPMPLGYIDEVAVTEGARGRGIGSALVANLLDEFEACGICHIGIHFLANNPLASSVWPHLGFRPLEIRLQGGQESRTPSDGENSL